MIGVKPLAISGLLSVLFLILTSTSEYHRLLGRIEVDTYEYPKELNVENFGFIVEKVDVSAIENDLLYLVDNLPSDRYYKSENGLVAANFIQTYLENLVADAIKPVFKLHTFQHDWKQPSIILRANGELDDTIIIGCHIDSINFRYYQDAPGVDDNLSGIVTVLQAIKQLIKLLNDDGIYMKNSVEFHFYAAEEIGAIGSTQVFRQYRKEGKQIVAMLQQDMTGYTQKSTDLGEREHFGLITDYESDSLAKFVRLIVEGYTTIPIMDTQCGKICSDHVSALMFEYPSVYVFESKVEYGNPFMHTNEDTIDKINFEHIKEHVKLTTAFMVELITQQLPTTKWPKDVIAFRYIDFIILVAMHETKRFVYMVIIFAAFVGSLYNIYLEFGKSSTISKEDDANSSPLGTGLTNEQSTHRTKKASKNKNKRV
ncbi:hypothetical protein CANINC_003575 [Pichia inconspicua]|uniref:Peptide hydrolase n=1 Tax=Pichia inconspicua TaxID=52247 RepID=A0A4T0WYC9_9ASCO|nr:hypothetical protein CANINC_003575 [[Candida] inconspicua]